MKRYRIVSLSGVIFTGLVLAGCGAGTHPSSAPTAASGVGMRQTTSPPSPNASIATIPSSSQLVVPASVPPCVAKDLSAHGGREGENMGAHMDVLLSNEGSAACVLKGLPTAVRLVHEEGSVVNTKLTIDPSRLVQAPVLLKPHAQNAGDLVLYWNNWCGPAPGPLQIQITLPGGRGTVSASVNGPPGYDYVPQCLQPKQASTLQILAAYTVWR